MNNLSLGQKIKAFRKRTGLSQLELETAIGAAPGSISRIESGKVNPTKETVIQISRRLGLKEKELSDLLEVRPLFPTQTEVDEAIKEVQDVMNDEGRIAYLIDDWGIMHAASKGIMDLVGTDETKAPYILGRHVLAICMDPQFGIRQLLDPNHFGETMAMEIARTRLETQLDLEHLMPFLAHIPDFEKVFRLSEKIPSSEVLSPKNKLVYLIVNGQKLKFQFSREMLKKNPRFETIEYFNPQPYE